VASDESVNEADGWRVGDIYDGLEEVPGAPTRSPSVHRPVLGKSKLLPFVELTEEDFERLTAAVARSVDGHPDVRRYGIRGQRQNGVDVVAISDRSNVIGYQAKKYRKFTAANLRKIVSEFAGNPPFESRSLVVTVACTTDDRKVVDALDAVRQDFPDFDIDLRGNEELSGQLVAEPEIVERFFGIHWREAFCVEGEQPPLWEQLEPRLNEKSGGYSASRDRLGLGGDGFDGVIATSRRIIRSEIERRRSRRAREVLLNRVLPRMIQNDIPAWLPTSALPEMSIPTELEAARIWRPKETEKNFGSTPGSLIDGFNRCAGRLLILGQAGAGKTHSIFSLLQVSLERAQRDSDWPMLLYVPINDWDDARRDFEPWVLRRVSELYKISEKIVAQWIENNWVGFALDGLDELPWRARNDAIRNLNSFIQSRPHLPILVASREHEYRECRRKLALNGTLKIRRLPPELVDSTLERAGIEWPTLVGASLDGRRLRQMLRTPLFLQLALLGSDRRSTDSAMPPTAVESTDNDSITSSIMDRYLTTAQERATLACAAADQAIYTWLPNLARNLRSRHRSLFYPDRIALELLPENDKMLVARKTATIAALLTFAVTLGVRSLELINADSHRALLIYGTFAIVGPIACAGVAYHNARSVVHNRPRSRRSTLRKSIPRALRNSLSFYVLLSAVVSVLPPSSIVGQVIFVVLAAATVVTPIRAFVRSSEEGESGDLPAYPGHELRTLAIVAILSGATLALVLAMTYSVVNYPIAHAVSLPHSAILSAPYYAVPFGFLISLANGGNDLICRLVAGRVLASEGLLPAKAMRVFDAMRRSSIFVPAAGGLTFYHATIRDHLARSPGHEDEPVTSER